MEGFQMENSFLILVTFLHFLTCRFTKAESVDFISKDFQTKK